MSWGDYGNGSIEQQIDLNHAQQQSDTIHTSQPPRDDLLQPNVLHTLRLL
jgi:hypothetical protein